MKLKDLVKNEYPNAGFIGIYEEVDGEIQPIYPEYTDELLETHGEMEVKDFQYVQSKDTLVVEFY